jgi:CheY-like chemotaxis protein
VGHRGNVPRRADGTHFRVVPADYGAMFSTRMLLVSTTGRPVVARIAAYRPQTTIEFIAPTGKTLATCSARMVETVVRAGFESDPNGIFQLPHRELDRLLRWIEDPDSARDLDDPVLFVGDADEAGRLSVALARLRLTPRRIDSPQRAVAELRAWAPALVVAFDGTPGMKLEAVVRALRQCDRSVPVVAVGGDAEEVRAAGAAVHLAAPADPDELVAQTSELLDLV